MNHNETTDILFRYSKGEINLEAANEALEAAGSNLRLVPGKNELTPAEIAETITGDSPADANGAGLLDTGTGTLDKVFVLDGELEEPVNEVREDGSTTMTAYVIIGGKRYEVRGDILADC